MDPGKCLQLMPKFKYFYQDIAVAAHLSVLSAFLATKVTSLQIVSSLAA